MEQDRSPSRQARRPRVPYDTGQITHHIAADVDAERDLLFQDLKATGDLADTYVVPGFHRILEGHNGGGDLWKTDGQLYVGVIEIKEGLPAAGNSN